VEFSKLKVLSWVHGGSYYPESTSPGHVDHNTKVNLVTWYCR